MPGPGRCCYRPVVRQQGPPRETIRRRANRACPKGKIGKMEISRLLLGGNLVVKRHHSRKIPRYVGSLAAHYNTPKKILETLATAEQQGINTLVIHTATNETVKSC